jgi:hypothetical protein
MWFRNCRYREVTTTYIEKSLHLLHLCLPHYKTFLVGPRMMIP